MLQLTELFHACRDVSRKVGEVNSRRWL